MKRVLALSRLTLQTVAPGLPRTLQLVVVTVLAITAAPSLAQQSAPSTPTVCSFAFSDAMTGQREHLWQTADCSHGLPVVGSSVVGAAQNGNGTSGQATCLIDRGIHYNHPTLHGATSGTVRCAYVPPAATDATVCARVFPDAVDGHRTHSWTAADCSHGVPPANWVAVGQARNGNGTGGQAYCFSNLGDHYNHPIQHGKTSGEVRCLFAKPASMKLNVCSYTFPTLGTGHQERLWATSDCSSGLPQPESAALGQAQNSNGTAGQAYCFSNLGQHYNHPQNGATQNTVGCLFVADPLPLPPPPPALRDSDFRLVACGGDGICLRSDTFGATPFEVTLTSSSARLPGTIAQGASVQVIGDRTGDGISEVAALIEIASATGFRPALSIVDPAQRRVLAQTIAPVPVAADVLRHSFTSYPRGPNGLKHPFLAPAFADDTNKGWGYLCLYRPGSNTSPRCGSDFQEVNTTLAMAGWFREAGGYLQDLDGDGWEDIHLIYHRTILTISPSNGVRIAETDFDVAAVDEPNAPTFFHSGRNYGIHTAFTGPDNARYALILAGVPVGSFADGFCNVSRFAAMLKTNPDNPAGRQLAWSDYFGFHSSIFSRFETQFKDDPTPVVARSGDFSHGCIHHFSDGRTTMDGQTAVIFNYFSGDAPLDHCLVQQYDLYFEPAFSPAKNAVWSTCFNKNLKQSGNWGMQVRGLDGVALTGSLQTYIWGRSDRIMPGGEIVYLLESLPPKVAFDLSNVPPSRLLVRSLVNGLYQVRGTFPVTGRPALQYVVPSGSIGAGSFTALAELTLADRDNDGLLDVQLSNGTWVGYDAASGTFIQKP